MVSVVKMKRIFVIMLWMVIDEIFWYFVYVSILGEEIGMFFVFDFLCYIISSME